MDREEKMKCTAKLYHTGPFRDHRDYYKLCSRWFAKIASWLLKGGCLQRYYCDECVKVTKAWKEEYGE